MSKYNDTEYDLFSRLFILNEFSEKKLDILSKQNISIVGIGGIGCPLSQYLISSGIKNLLLVDGDTVEKSNLNRQILFNNDDINKKKVEVAKEKLSKINPNTSLVSDEAFERVSMKDKKYEKVRRENLIVKSKSFSVKAGGF